MASPGLSVGLLFGVCEDCGAVASHECMAAVTDVQHDALVVCLDACCLLVYEYQTGYCR
jgi:hypothetical protein